LESELRSQQRRKKAKIYGPGFTRKGDHNGKKRRQKQTILRTSKNAGRKGGITFTSTTSKSRGEKRTERKNGLRTLVEIRPRS